MIKAFILDMHGLLIGKFPAEEYKRMVKELLGQKGYNGSTFDEWKRKYGTISAAMEDNGLRYEYLRLLDKIPATTYKDDDIIKLIRSAEQRIYVASNSSRKNTMNTLHGIGLSMSDFNYIITADDVSHSKPDTEMYEKILKLSMLEPQDFLVMGDRETDIEPAKKLGMNAMLCNYETFKSVFKKLSDEYGSS